MKFWGWFSQRITGLILAVLLAVHMYLTHFVSPEAPITLFSVQERLNISTILVVDYLLLFLGLYHGLYGLRDVIMDLFPKLNDKRVSVVLIVSGVCLAVFGTTTIMTIVA